MSEDTHSYGKNIFLDNSSSVRRSVIEIGSPKLDVPRKLNRSFMSGKIKLPSSRPPSTVSIIDENKEMDVIKSNKGDSFTKNKPQNVDTDADSLKKGDLGSSRFERRTSIQKNPIYPAAKGRPSSQDRYETKTSNIPNNTGMVNQGYVHTSQTSLNRGSMVSLPVYREQYCCTAKWTRLERILLMIIFILSFIIVCLVSLVGFMSNNGKLKDCSKLPGSFLRKVCEDVTS